MLSAIFRGYFTEILLRLEREHLAGKRTQQFTYIANGFRSSKKCSLAVI